MTILVFVEKMIIERDDNMAQQPLKACKYLGCRTLHRNAGLYCDEHKDIMKNKSSKEKMQRRLARNRALGYKPSDEERFYSSREWQRKRQLTKESQGFLCLNCLDNESYQEAKHVHHIVEILDDWSLRLDDDNLICLCSECHKGVHILYKRSEYDRLDTQMKLRKILNNYREGKYTVGKK